MGYAKLETNRLWRLKNPDKVKAYNAAYAKRNKPKKNDGVFKCSYCGCDFNKKRETQKFCSTLCGKTFNGNDKSKKRISQLKDIYIRSRLKQAGITNPSPEQIEEKILSLKIKRKIYEITRQINPSGNYGRTDNVLP